MELQFLHKTIRWPSNLQQIVAGLWVPYEKSPPPLQHIFVYQTHFAIYVVNPEKPDFSRSHYVQKFFGKVSHICLGPKIQEFDSFFAAYNSFIILYSYDKTEKYFTCKTKIKLDNILIRPNFLYFNFDLSELVVSCNHGGLGKYSISFYSPDGSSKISQKLIFSQKATGAVLSSFISQDKVFLVRVEGGYYFKMYNLQSMMQIVCIDLKVQGAPFDTVILAFPYNQGTAFIYSSGKLLYASDKYALSEIQTIDLNGTIDSPIISWCQYNESSVLLLSMKSKLYIMNDSWNLEPFRGFQPLPNTNIIRILQFLPNQIMMISSGDGTFLYGGIKPRKLESSLCQRGLVTSRYDPKLIPSFMTYSNTEVIQNRIGGFITSLQKRDVPIDGVTGMFSVFPSKNPKAPYGYLVFTNQTRSVVYYYVMNKASIGFQPAGPSALKDIPMGANTRYILKDFNENAQTIGFGMISSSTDIFLQATPDGLNVFSAEKKYDFKITKCTLFASTTKQVLVFYNKEGTIFSLTNEGIKPNRLNVEDDPRFVAFSLPPSNQDLPAEYFSLAVSRNVQQQQQQQLKNFICVYKCENFDQTQRAEIMMPHPVSSMCWDSHCRIIVGLNEGSVIILRYDPASMSLSAVNNYHIGDGPARVTNILSAQVGDFVIASNSRTAKITLKKDHLSVVPIATSTYCYVAKLVSSYYFVISGKSLFIQILSQSNSELSTTQIQAKIVVPQNKQAQMQGIPQPPPPPQQQPDDRNYSVVNVEYKPDSKNIVVITTKSNVFVESIFEFNDSSDNSTLMTVDKEEKIVASTILRDPRQPDDSFIVTLVHGVNQGNQYCVSRIISWKNRAVRQQQIAKMYKFITSAVQCVFMGGGTTIAAFYFYSMHKLGCVARIDNVGTNIVSLKAVQDNQNWSLFVGDENQGVMLYKMDPRRQFVCVWKEQMHRCISSLSFANVMVPMAQWWILTGDRSGNVTIYQNNAKGRRMSMILNYNVAAPVTGCSALGCQGQPLLLYTTITGGIGGFVCCKDFRLFPNQLANLSKLDFIIRKIGDVLYKLTEINIFESMIQMIPMTSVLDLDVVSIYFELKEDRRKEIFNDLKKEKFASDLPNDFTEADTMLKDMITQMKLLFLK